MKKDWKYKKLGEVCEVFCDGDWIESKDQSEDGIRLIQTGNVGNGVYRDKADKSKYISEETFKQLNCTEIFPGDILVSRLPDPIGRACIIPETGSRMITAVDCSIIRLKECINSNLFVYYTRSDRYSKNIDKYTTGTTRKRISRSNLALLSVPIPSLEEQQQIVAELDLLSGMIEKQKAQIDELDKLSQSIFYDMFGDTTDNERGWIVKRLEEIVTEECPISYGIVQPGDGVENGVPVVRPVDMVDTFISKKGLKQTTKEISDSYKKTILKGNELLLCVRGTTGLVSLSSPELKGCNVTRGITPIEFNDLNDRWFMYYQFLSPGVQHFVADYTKGATLKGINMKDVRNMPLICPPLSLQQEFAAKIEAIEAMKTKVRQSLKESETLFNSRMDYYFN